MDVLVTLTEPRLLRVLEYSKQFENVHLYVDGKPRSLYSGDRVWIIVRNHIIGFGIAAGVRNIGSFTNLAGEVAPARFRIWIPVQTFEWIKPVPMAGFRGYQYFEESAPLLKLISGDWKSPPPMIQKKNRRIRKRKPAI